MDRVEAHVSEVLFQRIERFVADARAAVVQSRQNSPEIHGVVQDLVHVLDRAHDLANADQGQVIASHGAEHRVRQDQCVLVQQRQARRAVDDHVVIRFTCARQTRGHHAVTVALPCDVQLGRGQRLVGDDHVQIRTRSDAGLLEGQAHHQHVIQRALGFETERGADVALAVGVDQEHLGTARREAGGHVHRGGRLARATLVVEYGQHLRQALGALEARAAIGRSFGRMQLGNSGDGRNRRGRRCRGCHRCRGRGAHGRRCRRALRQRQNIVSVSVVLCARLLDRVARIEQLPQAYRAHAGQDARAAVGAAGIVTTPAGEEHLRRELHLEARGAGITGHRAVGATAVAGFQAALGAVERIMSLRDAVLVGLRALFHLIAEVQLELVLAAGAGAIDDDHEGPRASCLSKCVQADVMERGPGPNFQAPNVTRIDL